MSINSVAAFRGEDLNVLMAQPPASCVDSIPARPMQPDSYEKQGSSTGAKVAKTALTLGVIAAGLGLLRGKVKAFQEIDLSKGFSGQDGIWGKCKFVIAKAGEFVNEYASKAWNKIKSIFGKPEKAAENSQNGVEGAAS